MMPHMLTYYTVLLGCNDSLVMCISPLASLEMDLTTKFRSGGIIAVFVGEQQKDWSERRRV